MAISFTKSRRRRALSSSPKPRGGAPGRFLHPLVEFVGRLPKASLVCEDEPRDVAEEELRGLEAPVHNYPLQPALRGPVPLLCDYGCELLLALHQLAQPAVEPLPQLPERRPGVRCCFDAGFGRQLGQPELSVLLGRSFASRTRLAIPALPALSAAPGRGQGRRKPRLQGLSEVALGRGLVAPTMGDEPKPRVGRRRLGRLPNHLFEEGLCPFEVPELVVDPGSVHEDEGCVGPESIGVQEDRQSPPVVPHVFERYAEVVGGEGIVRVSLCAPRRGVHGRGPCPQSQKEGTQVGAFRGKPERSAFLGHSRRWVPPPPRIPGVNSAGLPFFAESGGAAPAHAAQSSTKNAANRGLIGRRSFPRAVQRSGLVPNEPAIVSAYFMKAILVLHD